MKRSTLTIAVCAAAGFLAAVPARAMDKTTLTSGPRAAQAAELLSDFNVGATELLRLTGILESMTRQSQMSWMSHGTYLNMVGDQVRFLDGVLKELEAIQHEASGLQRQAIAAGRSQLSAVARAANAAIGIINEDRRLVERPAFRQTLTAMYNHADELTSRVGAILSYKNARLKLEAMNPPAAASDVAAPSEAVDEDDEADAGEEPAASSQAADPAEEPLA